MKENTVHGKPTIADPIALIGIGCRFPGGAHSPESFWELLKTGSDAIVDIPPERWNLRRFYDPDINKPGKMYIRQGGFLQQRIDEFDALFFGIAPREAECMDPQQRLLLETSWEALEDAGIPYESLAGSNTGVFIGAFTLDHKLTQMGKMNRHLIGTHTAIGSTMTILSNRISYTLDLRGPSISLDTACSSSLVALHLACQSIWRGECSLAMAGGVNVMMRPEYPVAMCKGGFLAPDGKSKSFDASANGYGRGEGAGIVVLKPLSEAVRDGDAIYALIRGTGANQDGRTNGITVPNPDAQTALIQEVCHRYGVDTQDIYYFEAHGTGTPVGDPLETKALGQVISQQGRQQPCLLGSVKASIGHLEAAAGVAGLIKTALCLSHRQIPPQANLTTPNPAIPFKELNLQLPRHLHDLAPDAETVCAGVNSFGYGGTNAHAILQNAPLTKTKTPSLESKGKVYVLPLSARSDSALTALAQAWLDRFGDGAAIDLADLCYSAACRRGHHNYRMAITGESWMEMRQQLSAFVEQGAAEYLACGKIGGESALKPVFIYTGMGPQWWAMGRELYHTESVYRDAVETCDAIFLRIGGKSILQEMLADEQVSNISDTTVAQPANFLIQVGLTALWRSLGIEPAAIVGHSVGEVSAAYAAGVLSLEDAVMVSFHRSRIQKKAAGLGKMLAVGISQQQCVELLELAQGEVSIAAINGPTSVTLAGTVEGLETIAQYLTERGDFNRFLQVEVAYHSHFMEPLKEEVRLVLAGLQPHRPSIPLYSTVTGDRVDDILYDAEYWCNNIREPVYFAKAMTHIVADGHRIFLEVGPHPVLSTSIKECCRQQGVEPLSIASLRRGSPERLTLNFALAELYVAGCKIAWRQLYPENVHYVKLPTYPWQREFYWREDPESIEDRLGEPLHPLLDRRLLDPKPIWQGRINRQFLPYLDDHQVDGLVIMPGAAYVEAGLAAYQQLTGQTSCVIERLSFHQALVLDGQGSDPLLHISLDQHSGEYGFFSRNSDEGAAWVQHASGTLAPQKEAGRFPINRTQIADRCVETVDIDKLYDQLAMRGLMYGPYFRTVQHLQRCQGEVLARIEIHPSLMMDDAHYCLHPSMLDGCFQSLIVALEQSDKFYMPVSVKRVIYHAKPNASCWCYGKLSRVTDQSIEGDIILFDQNGQRLVEVEGLRCRALDTQQRNRDEDIKQWVYAWQWTEQALLAAPSKTGCWLVLGDVGGIGEALCQTLESHAGNQVVRIPINHVYEHEQRSVQPLNEKELKNLSILFQNAATQHCVGVVYLWGLDQRVQHDPVGIDQAGTALQIIQMLMRVFDRQTPRLYMVTQGCQPVGEPARIDGFSQTALVGMARVALNEYPALRCTLIDLEAANPRQNITALAQEILANDNEDDIALRETRRYVHRLERLSSVPSTLQATPLVGNDIKAFQIKGQQEHAHFQSLSHGLPKVGEVAITVGYINLSGLRLNGGDENETRNGYFSLGVITATGENVSHWQVGERVIAVVEGLPASSVICPVEQIFSCRYFEELPDNEIIALTTTLIPAYYALSTIARVSPGESVLIDAHMGVTALASHWIARGLAARPRLYDNYGGYKDSFGSLQVTDTTQPDFTGLLADENNGLHVRAWLHGGETNNKIDIGHLLSPDAHEIVLGGSVNPNNLPSTPRCRSTIDALMIAFNAPKLFEQLLLGVGRLLLSYDGYHPPLKVMSAQDGLAYLKVQHAGHSQFVPVANMNDKTSMTVIAPSRTTLLEGNGTYLITGGFGGFGLEAAHWLVKHGAKHLVLVGRRGAVDDSVKQSVRSLEQQGVNVMAVAADIADASHVEKMLARIVRECPPLKGVLHAAALLDDAAISELTPERMSKVMQAKALGAWHLHKLTQTLPLDFFLLFSSVSALIGNARQANYVAANTVLDALANHRKALGLPATSINWGAIATGMAVESEEVKKHLELMGMSTLTVEQALDTWAALQDVDQANYGVMACDWTRWQAFEPTGGRSPRFSKLMVGIEPQKSTLTECCLTISALPELERPAAMASALAEQVAKTLRIPMGKIDLQKNLAQMGVDSLMSAELQSGILRVFGVRISTLELMRGQNLVQLAGLLMERAFVTTTSADNALDTEASLVDRMSEQEIDQLLMQILVSEEN